MPESFTTIRVTIVQRDRGASDLDVLTMPAGMPQGCRRSEPAGSASGAMGTVYTGTPSMVRARWSAGQARKPARTSRPGELLAASDRAIPRSRPDWRMSRAPIHSSPSSAPTRRRVLDARSDGRPAFGRCSIRTDVSTRITTGHCGAEARRRPMYRFPQGGRGGVTFRVGPRFRVPCARACCVCGRWSGTDRS